MNITNKFRIYTDGSCRGNGKENADGGWAYVIINANDRIIADQMGFEENATNNRMELTALAKALEASTEIYGAIFEVYTDSAYIHNCYTQKWYKKWLENGWINSSKQPVKNKELWEYIIPYFNNEKYSFNKVKGHSTDEYNNIVDRMAVKAACMKENPKFL